MTENKTILVDDLNFELQFTFSRSSGPGGQHINKVNTKVELRFQVLLSKILSPEQKGIISQGLAKQINQEGELIVISQATRSQLQNKQDAIDKFYTLINTALKPKKKRKPTRISRAAKEKRLKEKKEHAEKKDRRKFDS